MKGDLKRFNKKMQRYEWLDSIGDFYTLDPNHLNVGWIKKAKLTETKRQYLLISLSKDKNEETI